MPATRSMALARALDEAPISRFHLRAVVVCGMGFFTDAYDLFVIGIAATLIKQEWQLSTGRVALLNAVMLAAAVVGACALGRVADLVGRKRVCWLVAVIMVAGALGSALAPSFWVLIVFRVVLGLGVGGDYPVSAVLMSEYANRKDRGRPLGMVFAAQAAGLIVGPLLALVLLGAGRGDDVVWRILLGVGAVPAAAVLYLRRKVPESPRFRAQVLGRHQAAVSDLSWFSRGAVIAEPKPALRHRMGLRAFLTNRRWLAMLAGTAGCWLLLDYAFYGNTISTPQIIGLISPGSSTSAKIAIQLALFVGCGAAGLPAGDRLPGPDRAPAAAAGRLCHAGDVFRGARAGTPADDRSGTVPAGVWGELLLHRVRAERHHVRAAQRGVPGHYAGHRAWHFGRCGQAGCVRRRLCLPVAAGLAGTAGHPAVHRRDLSPWPAADPDSA